MVNSKNLKFILGLLYFIILLLFLSILFSKFSLSEIRSYEFLRINSEYFNELKEKNLLITFFIVFVFIIFWVLMLGFGMPVALMSGFILGKWLGTLCTVLGCSLGSLLLYLTSKYFLYDYIVNNFQSKYINLAAKFKKNDKLLIPRQSKF